MTPRTQQQIFWEIQRVNRRERVHWRKQKRRERLYPWLWTLAGLAWCGLCYWVTG